MSVISCCQINYGLTVNFICVLKEIYAKLILKLKSSRNARDITGQSLELSSRLSLG